LEETYGLITNLETFLGKKIKTLTAATGSPRDPFDHFLDLYGGYLPSSQARWCTNQLKLVPFENFVGDDPVVSFVAIRGDEEREAYISKKPNIQSIFPFRKNIWSEDVVLRILRNENRARLAEILNGRGRDSNDASEMLLQIIGRELSPAYPLNRKLNDLLRVDTKLTNRLIFAALKETDYPLGSVDSFPVIDDEEVTAIDGVFRILNESGVGLPKYYEKFPYEVDGKEGYLARSRSGCYFCFFQQKIEWVWLYERHPELFDKAVEYEKAGYTWMQNERLEDLIIPERVAQIKRDFTSRTERKNGKSSGLLVDILDDGEGCAACFI
jgi:hypothetical protein